jgi:hypothetical protein
MRPGIRASLREGRANSRPDEGLRVAIRKRARNGGSTMMVGAAQKPPLPTQSSKLQIQRKLRLFNCPRT